MRGSVSTMRLKRSAAGWMFVVGAALLIAIFYFYPMIQALILSFHTGTGSNLTFHGIGNYERMFVDAAFKTAVTNTFIYLLFQVPLMVLLALILAVLLNDRKLMAKGLFRIAIFLPCITSLVAYSVVFKYLFSTDGLVNTTLLNMGIVSEPIGWITDPFWAKVTIILAITWRWTGYNMIFYLSSLQHIEPAVYESAKIDGASAVRQFFSITIPLLKPIILFTTITSTIGTLQLFDEVMNITSGGPGNATMTISQYIYNLSFKYSADFGYAATVSYSIVIMIVILAIIQFRAAGDRRA